MREMKDSGVEWIGEIPATWEVRKVKSILNLQTGFTPETKNDAYYSDDGVDWVTIGDLNGNKYIPSVTRKKISKTYIELFSPEITPAGSLLYSFKLSVGQTAFTDRPVYTNEAIASFFETGNYSMQFLRFASFLIKYNANTNIYGAHLLNQDLIKNALLVVPSLREQSIIADFLNQKSDQIDTLIQNVQTQIEKLKAYKQSLITEVVTKGLDPTVPMKDSGVDYLGRIPIGWSIISIGQAFIYVGGFAFKSELFSLDKTKYQVLRIGNVKNDNLILDNKQIYIDESSAEFAKSAKVRPDDILFTMTGTKGKQDYFYTVLVNEKHMVNKHLFINQRVGIFRQRSNRIKMSFANYILKEKRILDYIFLSETGTANQGNLGIENIARTKLYLPTLEEQEEIVIYLDKKSSQIDRLIAIKQAKIEKLEQYKRSLIYEYVTGKKEVV